MAEPLDVEQIQPGYRGFVAFAEAIGQSLPPYMRRIARAFFESLELAVIMPKGCGKTHVAALLGLHHLLVTPDAEVRIVAASRRHSEIVLKRMKMFARHDLVADVITITYFELRHEELHGDLMVISAEGGKLHGDSPSLIIGDEVWQWKSQLEMLEAVRETQIKNPDCRTIYISTASAHLDSPLGELREEAMASPYVKRRGATVEAKGDDLHWLEWSLAEDATLDDMRRVKAVNPAPYITTESLRRQRRRLSDAHFAQMHCCRWGVGEASWLPEGAWQRCADPDMRIEDGEAVILGIDIGGERSASAIAIVTPDLRVKTEVFQTERAVLKVVERIHELAGTFSIENIAYDTMRFTSDALRLEEEGFTMIQYPPTPGRLTAISEHLREVIVEEKLTHGDEEVLNQHVARAIATKTFAGWRLDKVREQDQIDAIVAVAMAVDSADRHKPKPEPKFHGFI